MTTNQPPAPTEATALDPLVDVLESMCPFSRDEIRDRLIAALAAEGQVIFGPDEVATITRALQAEARGIGSYPVACLEILQRLAARQPEGVRDGE